LLTVAENEAALVGIVGHELSHLDRGHLLTPLKNSKRMEQTFAGEFVPHTFLASQRTMWKTFARPFRPEDESMADLDGATWAFRAGYDPREMARLFDTLHRNRLDPKLPWSEFFRTHPYSDDRCEAILKRYHDLQHDSPSDALYRGQTNLVRRIPRSQQQFPE
ncbi:MAG: M48 family metalloprotease, partial [Planctomycetes bacterium]|nr:M48 family metalloprotease [Planctomycetota bacterium]